MKRCPYCAEEIQDAVVFCRYCHKKVKGIWFRRIVIGIIILALIFFAVIHRAEMRNLNYRVRFFFRDIGNIWKSFKIIIRDARDGLVTLKNYKQQYILMEKGEE